MSDPRCLAFVHILAVHSDQIQAHGGSLGLQDRGLLESALERPRNRFHYEPTSDLPSLAASYGFGIAKNHPFVDGNKRVAFQAMYLFLGLNGLRIDASEEEVVATILSLASGDLDESRLAVWLRDHITPR
ncbi:MAG TPA: type II toxin-antitoxin system death-on-curing family toxin [Longimicrobiales bacterium]|nr:type II toxin-antitoxin system death-on-curing family toxin [Longimicrobiales bacterium]